MAFTKLLDIQFLGFSESNTFFPCLGHFFAIAAAAIAVAGLFSYFWSLCVNAQRKQMEKLQNELSKFVIFPILVIGFTIFVFTNASHWAIGMCAGTELERNQGQKVKINRQYAKSMQKKLYRLHGNSLAKNYGQNFIFHF